MDQDNQIVLSFASISGKKVEADFEGGQVTSDGGALFLRTVEKGVGVIRRLVGAIQDRRDERYVDHPLKDLLTQRIFQIALGYEDCNDCDDLRSDPGLKTACDRLPISGEDLASQPTMSRLENGARRRDLYGMAKALVDTFIGSYETPPEAIILDLDDTDDPVHGAQQQSLFNGYYSILKFFRIDSSGRCALPFSRVISSCSGLIFQPRCGFEASQVSVDHVLFGGVEREHLVLQRFGQQVQLFLRVVCG